MTKLKYLSEPVLKQQILSKPWFHLNTYCKYRSRKYDLSLWIDEIFGFEAWQLSEGGVDTSWGWGYEDVELIVVSAFSKHVWMFCRLDLSLFFMKLFLLILVIHFIRGIFLNRMEDMIKRIEHCFGLN